MSIKVFACVYCYTFLSFFVWLNIVPTKIFTNAISFLILKIVSVFIKIQIISNVSRNNFYQ